MPATAVCSVHPKETSIQFEPIPTYGQSLRHSCYPDFLAAMQVYSILDERKDRKRDERLRYCRGMAYFYRHKETGEVRVSSNACHLRWCPVCARAKRNYIAHAVAEWVSSMKYPKFLTLTLKHTNAPLGCQIKCLYDSFRELRRRKEFKHRVTGGIWFFQIKKSKFDHLWHPHLHCLISGLYIKQRNLSDMWCQITFGSTIVDIRPVRDPQKAANDAARYASCPGTLVGLSNVDACDLVNAVHGKRICGTWGTGRVVSLRPAKQTDKDQWENIGEWEDVMNTRHSNPNADAIFSAWMDKRPLEAGIDCCRDYHIDSKMSKKQQKQMTLDEVYKPERIPP